MPSKKPPSALQFAKKQLEYAEYRSDRAFERIEDSVDGLDMEAAVKDQDYWDVVADFMQEQVDWLEGRFGWI